MFSLSPQIMTAILPSPKRDESRKNSSSSSTSRGRRITFIAESSLGMPPITLHEADITLRLLGWSEAVDVWIRARMGAKRNVFWTLASDNDLLRYLTISWAHDCQEFFFALRPRGRPPPNTIMV
jgi:hypothetical protein